MLFNPLWTLTYILISEAAIPFFTHRPWLITGVFNGYNELSNALSEDLLEFSESLLAEGFNAHVLLIVRRANVNYNFKPIKNVVQFDDQSDLNIHEFRESMMERHWKLLPVGPFTDGDYYSTDVWSFFYIQGGELYLIAEISWTASQFNITRHLLELSKQYFLYDRHFHVFWGHGNMFIGLPGGAEQEGTPIAYMADGSVRTDASVRTGSDMLFQSSVKFMSLSDIKYVLKETGTHLDILGFDACMMSNYEVVRALAPYTDYIIASELKVPASGWDWGSLYMDSDDTSQEVVYRIVDGFADTMSFMGRWTMVGISTKAFQIFSNEQDVWLETLRNCIGTNSTKYILQDAMRLVGQLEDCINGLLNQCHCIDLKGLYREILNVPFENYLNDRIATGTEESVVLRTLYKYAIKLQVLYDESIIYHRQGFNSRSQGIAENSLKYSLGGMSIFYPTSDDFALSNECHVSHRLNNWHKNVNPQDPWTKIPYADGPGFCMVVPRSMSVGRDSKWMPETLLPATLAFENNVCSPVLPSYLSAFSIYNVPSRIYSYSGIEATIFGHVDEMMDITGVYILKPLCDSLPLSQDGFFVLTNQFCSRPPPTFLTICSGLFAKHEIFEATFFTSSKGMFMIVASSIGRVIYTLPLFSMSSYQTHKISSLTEGDLRDLSLLEQLSEEDVTVVNGDTIGDHEDIIYHQLALVTYTEGGGVDRALLALTGSVQGNEEVVVDSGDSLLVWTPLLSSDAVLLRKSEKPTAHHDEDDLIESLDEYALEINWAAGFESLQATAEEVGGMGHLAPTSPTPTPDTTVSLGNCEKCGPNSICLDVPGSASVCSCETGYEGGGDSCVPHVASSRWTTAGGVPKATISYVIEETNYNMADKELILRLFLIIDSLADDSIDRCSIDVSIKKHTDIRIVNVVISQPYASRFFIPFIGAIRRKIYCKRKIKDMYEGVPEELWDMENDLKHKVIKTGGSRFLYPPKLLTVGAYTIWENYPPAYDPPSSENVELFTDYFRNTVLLPEKVAKSTLNNERMERLASYNMLHVKERYFEAVGRVTLSIDMTGIFWRRWVIHYAKWIVPQASLQHADTHVIVTTILVFIVTLLYLYVTVCWFFYFSLAKIVKRRYFSNRR